MPNAQDGRYAYDRPWSLTAERLATERTFMNASEVWHPPMPVRPNPEDMIPPRYGYPPHQLTINDILDGYSSRLSLHARDAMPTDFSGQTGSYAASMRPTGPGSGGIS